MKTKFNNQSGFQRSNVQKGPEEDFEEEDQFHKGLVFSFFRLQLLSDLLKVTGPMTADECITKILIALDIDPEPFMKNK